MNDFPLGYYKDPIGRIHVLASFAQTSGSLSIRNVVQVQKGVAPVFVNREPPESVRESRPFINILLMM